MKRTTTLKVLMTLLLICGTGNVWGENVTIAYWGKVSLSKGIYTPASKYKGTNAPQMTTDKSMGSSGGTDSHCSYSSSAGGATIVISGLPKGYDTKQITFYTRASGMGNMNVSYSTDGGNTYKSAGSASITTSEQLKTITLSAAVSNVTNIKFVHTATYGSLYFGTVTVIGEASATLPQTQEVTIASSGYSSFSSTMDLELPEGLNAYYVSSCDGSNITLAQIEDVIPANTGVVLNGNGGETYTLTQTTGATAIDDNLLVAVSEETTVYSTSDEGAKTNFILKDGQFHPLAKDATATVGAGKCYLQVATSDINAAGPLTFTFDDATAINAISNATQNGIRYNLSGQAVGKDFKGIVIVNGKKFLQK